MSEAARRSRATICRSGRGSVLAAALPRSCPLPPALDRRADPHRLAIFGDRAPGETEALLLEQLDQLVVAQHSVSAAISLLDRRLDRLGRSRPRRRPPRRPSEEIFELEQPAVAQQIFVRGDPADGDSCISIASATSRRSAASAPTRRAKKPSCCLTISLDDLDDGPRALVERLHQPVGALPGIR
jgi:hypothetical protein